MTATSGTTVTTPIQFITEALAEAEDNQFTTDKYEAAIETLAAAAKRDTEIELVISLRKKTQVGLVGISNGEVSKPSVIIQFLMRALGM